jgi:hypothetical protein
MIYVASRVHHAETWKRYRAAGRPITSTWIDEAGAGETASFADLWLRILEEIAGSTHLLFYAEPADVPLKGAYVEVGAALMIGLPVIAVLPGIVLESRTCRPIGSWLEHPAVITVQTLDAAFAFIQREIDIAGDGP